MSTPIDPKDIPAPVLEAARQVEAFFANRGALVWKLGGMQSRDAGAAARRVVPSGTHTYAALEVTPATYREIADKFRDAGYDHAFDPETGAIDMHGIGIVEDPAVPASPRLDDIATAVKGYYAALDARDHGGIAMTQAFHAIEHALGMSWGAHRQALASEVAP